MKYIQNLLLLSLSASINYQPLLLSLYNCTTAAINYYYQLQLCPALLISTTFTINYVHCATTDINHLRTPIRRAKILRHPHHLTGLTCDHRARAVHDNSTRYVADLNICLLLRIQSLTWQRTRETSDLY